MTSEDFVSINEITEFLPKDWEFQLRIGKVISSIALMDNKDNMVWCSRDHLSLADGIFTLKKYLTGRTMSGEKQISSQARSFQSDAPACWNCGNITYRMGSCYTCRVCGETSGCG